MNTYPDLPLARSIPQMAMSGLTLAFVLLIWWYANPFWTLVSFGLVAPTAVLFGAAGVCTLLIGALRYVVNAQSGKYFFLFAAAALGVAGYLVGYRDYLIGQKLLAVFASGAVLALTGALLVAVMKKPGASTTGK